ncbi:MAG: hypothetical protein WCX33_01665 [Candidatus Shapirobacteria bacterium]
MLIERNFSDYSNSREFGDGPSLSVGRKKMRVYDKQIPIQELLETIETRNILLQTPEHDENPYEQTRRIVKEEQRKTYFISSPIEKEWLDFSKEAFISSENIESVRQQIKKLKNIRLKNIDDDEQLIKQLVIFQARTPIYNLEGRDPIKFTDDILALPIMTENISQEYLYVGNLSNNERKDRGYTKYKTPQGEHTWNTFKIGNEFNTTNNRAILIRKSIYGKSKIKQYW